MATKPSKTSAAPKRRASAKKTAGKSSVVHRKAAVQSMPETITAVAAEAAETVKSKTVSPALAAVGFVGGLVSLAVGAVAKAVPHGKRQ